MKEHTRKLLAKAEESIQASSGLLEKGHEEFAISRAYYAMFYTADALLNEKDLRFSKHGGVLAAYGQHFAKTGALDPKFHRWLIDAFDKRVTGDYGVDACFSEGEVALVISQARQFLEAARGHLGP